MTPEFWSGKRVLVTGHTGFKGAWLAFWLSEMGAQVTGFARAPETDPNLSELLGLGSAIDSRIGELGDDSLLSALSSSKPEVVIHFAAQSLVRRSYADPVETFETNVVGTVRLLHLISETPSVRSIVVATSDKCYENREWDWGYRETDALGGHDPYSASKGCTELAVASMRRSYFGAGKHHARLATVRAGNVIGGGDWSEDRLVPDIIRGCLTGDKTVEIRSPYSVRPWQHVIEPLSGYLTVAEHLDAGDPGIEGAWNFGPGPADEKTVLEVSEALVRSLGEGELIIARDAAPLHEANLLRLDCARANHVLGWRPVFEFKDTLQLTADWYGAWHHGDDVADLCRSQLASYIERREADVER